MRDSIIRIHSFIAIHVFYILLHHRGTYKKLEVAVKRVNKGSLSDQEKDVLTKCKHPNIVQYFEVVSYFYTCLL